MVEPQQSPRSGRDRAGTGRGEDEQDEALGDAAEDALDATDVDPTGNVVDNDATAANADAARGTEPGGR